MAMGFAATAYANGEVPDEGCVSECEPSKGNNGWGNGEDDPNPGTEKGTPAQVETKKNESIPDKFDGKFEGR